MDNAWFLSTISRENLTIIVKCGENEDLEDLSRDITKIIVLAVKCNCKTAEATEDDDGEIIIDILFADERCWKNFCQEFLAL